MMGIWSEHSSTFLQALALFTALAFSLPILIAPLRWARLFGWQVDQKSDLALYFGRSLGAFALTASCCAWYVAARPELQPFFFHFLTGVFGLMALVHVIGAVQKVQPWTETAEIPFWIALTLSGILFCPCA